MAEVSAKIIRAWERVQGNISGWHVEQLDMLLEDIEDRLEKYPVHNYTPEALLLEAITEVGNKQRASIGYLRAVVESWLSKAVEQDDYDLESLLQEYE